MSEAPSFTPVEIQAMQYLYSHGPDVMPREVENENQLAAILIFGELKRRGLVIQSIEPTLTTWRLTDKGQSELFRAVA